MAASIVQAQLVGGGYVILKVDPGARVTFAQQSYTADAEGFVAIGFDRDLAGEFNVRILDADQAEPSQLLLNIAARKYQEQYINGIPNRLVNPPESALPRIFRETAEVKQARAVESALTDWRVEKFIWPVKAPITGVYGSQRYYNGEPRAPHWGVDLAAPTGTPVKAPAGGRVVLAEPDLYFSGGTVIVDHGGGLSSSFLHLSKIHVQVGDAIRQGQVIAVVGATGRVTGPHLDWRMNLHGVRVDAQLWVSAP